MSAAGRHHTSMGDPIEEDHTSPLVGSAASHTGESQVTPQQDDGPHAAGDTANDAAPPKPDAAKPAGGDARSSARRSSLASSFEHEASDKAFNWRTGRYPPSSRRAPTWAFQCLKLAMAVLFYVLAFIINLLTQQSSWNMSRIAEDRVRAFEATGNLDEGELAFTVSRALMLVAIPMGMHALAKLALYGIAPTTFWLVKRFGGPDKEVPRRTRAIVDRMFALRAHIAFAVAMLGAKLVVDSLYRLMAIDLAQSIFSGQAKGPTKRQENILATSLHGGYATDRFVNRGVHCVLVGAVIILGEKMLMQAIASSFHRRTFGQRIEDIRTVRRTARALKVAIVTASDGAISSRQPAASVIAKGCAQHAATEDGSFGAEDMAAFVGEETVAPFAELVDLGGTSRWTESEMLEALEYWEKEEEHVRLGVSGSVDIIAKLDRVLMALCVPVILFFVLALLNVSLATLTTAIGGLVTMVFALTNKTVIQFFESVVFVIFSHPFDVGDKVTIKGTTYRVKELGLWTCAFLASGNRVTYFRNAELASSDIANLRRSGAQSESIVLHVLASTPRAKLAELEQRMQAFVAAHPRDYAGPTSIDDVTIMDAHSMAVEFDVSHRTNFQDGGAKARRTTKYWLALRDAVAELGIQLRPADVVIRS